MDVETKAHNKDSQLFKQQKATCLSKTDFSRKGSVDERISDLVQFINACDQYFTTSSCSGRICLFEEPEVSTRKKGCRWLHVTHNTCDGTVLIESIRKSEADASLKFEPFVLHVQCESLSDAQTMHEVAVASGFRNSGLTVGKRGKIMAVCKRLIHFLKLLPFDEYCPTEAVFEEVQIDKGWKERSLPTQNVRSTHSLEVPVTRNGIKIVSDEYVDYAVELANTKMNENFDRINRFHDNLVKALNRNQFVHAVAVKPKPLRQQQNDQDREVQPLTNVDDHSSIDNKCEEIVTCGFLFDET